MAKVLSDIADRTDRHCICVINNMKWTENEKNCCPVLTVQSYS